jgi:hypothetical protein
LLDTLSLARIQAIQPVASGTNALIVLGFFDFFCGVLRLCAMSQVVWGTQVSALVLSIPEIEVRFDACRKLRQALDQGGEGTELYAFHSLHRVLTWNLIFFILPSSDFTF